jgi:hypothetical protein
MDQLSTRNATFGHSFYVNKRMDWLLSASQDRPFFLRNVYEIFLYALFVECIAPRDRHFVLQ